MKYAKHLFFVAISILFTSCSFNKIFLQPYKISSSNKNLKFKNPQYSSVIYISGDNRQPTFTKNGIDTIDLEYTIESVFFESKNGNNLNGWLLKPKNIEVNTTILHLHGNAGFMLEQYELMTPLLKNGFQVFVFDYSGFGFSEGKATKKNVLIDAHSALDYLKKREDVLKTKFVLYGQSLGGHLSAVVATQRQSEIDCLVIEGAFSSHKDIAAYTIPIIGRIFVKEEYSATKSIKNYNKPLLVIHSVDDKVIPFKMGKKIYSKANNPKEFYEIQKEHVYGPIYYADEISGKIKNMLNIKTTN